MQCRQPSFLSSRYPFHPSEEISHIYSAAAYIGPLANELLNCRRRLTKFHARLPDPELRAIATKLSNLQVRAHAIFFTLNSRFEALAERAQEHDTINRRPLNDERRPDVPSLHAPDNNDVEIVLNGEDGEDRARQLRVDHTPHSLQAPTVEPVNIDPSLSNTALDDVIAASDEEIPEDLLDLPPSLEHEAVNSGRMSRSAVERQGPEVQEGTLSSGRKSYRVKKIWDSRSQKPTTRTSRIPPATPGPLGIQTSEYNPLLGKNVEEITIDGSLFPDVVSMPDFAENVPQPLAFPTTRVRQNSRSISRRRRDNRRNANRKR